MKHEELMLSVTQALALAKQALEGITVSIMGEVSELSDRPGYKAVYFTLADEGAALSCLIWSNVYTQLGFRLQRGMLLEVRGRFSLYAPKGRMNFIVSQINVAGEGALRLRVAELARRLAGEGLIDPARRRPLPAFPQRIGLVTSPHGKAVHDVLRTLRRRYPLAEVILAGVMVEGASAAQAVQAGLAAVCQAGAEIVLVVRGGGSYEDLMPFNDEGLARAIAAAAVPVVTGIGHEPDTTIADMVADLRASTPTAAAESVAPDAQELGGWLQGARGRLRDRWRSQLGQMRARLAALAERPLLRDPQALYLGPASVLEQSAMRLHQALPLALRDDRERLLSGRAALARAGLALSAGRRGDLRLMNLRLRSKPQALERASGDVTLRAAQLESLSPLAVLARGYAAAYDGAGQILSSIRVVRPGDAIRVRLKDGSLGCTVREVCE
jgi:exodeoxyribonuclease VII large subunit